MKFLKTTSQYVFIHAFVLFAFFLPSPLMASSLGCSKIVVSGPPIWPPHVILDTQTNTRHGTAFELAQKIFTDLGVEFVQAAPKPWKRVVRDLTSGDIDFVVALLDDPERRKLFEYSIPWTEDVYAAIARSDAEWDYETVESLKGRLGAYYSGIRLPPPLNAIDSAEYMVASVSVIPNLYRILLEKRVDYLVVSVDSFFRLMPEEYKREDFAVLEKSAVHLPIHMAFSRKSKCIKYIDQLNLALEQYKMDAQVK
jgi:ABC-type amino acid transport substrate-binding protein